MHWLESAVHTSILINSKVSEAGGAITASDGASEVAQSLTSVSTLPPQELLDPPHIITGRENSDGYFKDKVYLLQEQQRENNDGKVWGHISLGCIFHLAFLVESIFNQVHQ